MHPAQVGFLLARLGAYAAAAFAGRLELIGTTPPVAGLLRAIGRQPDRSQQEIAAELGTAPSRLVGLVDGLETAGLVRRTRNDRDRRLYALRLTAAGEQRLAEIGKVAREHGRALLAPLGAEDRAQLGGLLSRLADGHGLTPGVHPGHRLSP